MKVYFNLIFVLGMALFSACAGAAGIQIKLLDSSPDGPMSFSPNFVKANIGDTITFSPGNAGHNSASLLVPKGAASWRGPFDKPFSIKLEKEGVYIYACDSHKMMGMVGIIQVGKATNLEEARKTANELSAQLVMNKDRFAKALSLVQ